MDNIYNKADIKVGQVWITINGDYVKVLAYETSSLLQVQDVENGIICQEARKNLVSLYEDVVPGAYDVLF